jgi:hypothetical protein
MSGARRPICRLSTKVQRGSERNSSITFLQNAAAVADVPRSRIRRLHEEIAGRKKDLHEYLDVKAQGTLVEM